MLAPFVASAADGNLLKAGDFDSKSDAWGSLGGKTRYSIIAGKGRDGSPCLQYLRESAGEADENSHYDQIVKLQPRTVYVAGIWGRGEGDLRPALRIAGMKWNTVGGAMCEGGEECSDARVIFNSGAMTEARFQIFGGALTVKRESAIGRSWVDDAYLRLATERELEAMRAINATVDASNVLRDIDPKFFGVNSLFWIDDDKARTDGKIAKHLRELPCGFLRFPGGEVADNYHWKTNTLDSTKDFPFKDGPTTLDCDEFIVWCRAIGAEPVFVVNLESAFLKNDLRRGAREAADWVRYANRELGYNVKYWEVGNESDLKGTRYATTAKEYGEAFKLYATEMKKVDPSIQVGALGPREPNGVAPIETLTDADRKLFRSLKKSERKLPFKDIAALSSKRGEGEPWWPTVIDIAGEQIDFIIIHRYTSVPTYDAFITSRSEMDETVAKLVAYLKEQFPDHKRPIALTEWNTWKNAELVGMGQALAVGELLVAYLNGGVDMANFWPMRYQSKSQFRSLLDFDTNEPRPPYHVMKLFASNIGERLVEAKCESPSGVVCAGLNGDALSIFVINKQTIEDGAKTTIKVDGLAMKTITAEALTAPSYESDELSTGEIAVTREGDTLSFIAPPHSLTLITIGQ